MSRYIEAVAILLVFLAGAAPCQTLPPGFAVDQVRSSTSLGLPGPLAGIEFDAAGTTLFIAASANLAAGQIHALPVIRNGATNKIVAFGAAVPVALAPFADAGLQMFPGGILVWTTYPSHALDQAFPGGSRTTFPLAPTGAPASTGGMLRIGAGLPGAGDILVSSYCTGQIWKVTATQNVGGTFTPDAGSGSLYAALPPGTVGMRRIPSGPDVGSLLVANFDTGDVSVLAVDATTGAARLDANGQPVVTPFITGLIYVDAIAFDPLTNDLFLTVFNMGDVIYQISGFAPGNALPTVTSIGTGCLGSHGAIPTLQAPLWPFLGNAAFGVDVASAPPSSLIYLLPSFALAQTPLVLYPGCLFHLDVASTQSLINAGVSFPPMFADPTGALAVPIALPANSGLAGFRFSLQAVPLDPPSPAGVILTNAIEILMN